MERRGTTIGLGVLGALAGGTTGFLLRPSAMLFGQLPFSMVITRGLTMDKLDQLMMGHIARTSFTYLVTGLIAGALLGGIIGYLLDTRGASRNPSHTA